MTTHKHAAYNI